VTATQTGETAAYSPLGPPQPETVTVVIMTATAAVDRPAMAAALR
jgi:hypothetical protein